MKQILEFLKPELYLAQMLFATQLAKLGNVVLPSPSETLNSYQIPAVLRKKLDSLEQSENHLRTRTCEFASFYACYLQSAGL